MVSKDELACVYAALILADDQETITTEKIQTILKTSGVSVEPYWSGLFARALEGDNVNELISNISSGVGAAPAFGGGAAPAAEEKKEEEKRRKMRRGKKRKKNLMSLMMIWALAGKMTEQQKKEIKRLFKECDTDNSNTLECDELMTILKKIFGPTLNEEMVKGTFKKVDSDGSGTINYEEFLKMFEQHMRGPSEDDIKEAFEAVDTDGSNTLTKEEVKVALSNIDCPLSEDALGDIFKKADTDNSGSVNYKEFAKFISDQL